MNTVFSPECLSCPRHGGKILVSIFTSHIFLFSWGEGSKRPWDICSASHGGVRVRSIGSSSPPRPDPPPLPLPLPPPPPPADLLLLDLLGERLRVLPRSLLAARSRAINRIVNLLLPAPAPAAAPSSALPAAAAARLPPPLEEPWLPLGPSRRLAKRLANAELLALADAEADRALPPAEAGLVLAAAAAAKAAGPLRGGTEPEVLFPDNLLEPLRGALVNLTLAVLVGLLLLLPAVADAAAPDPLLTKPAGNPPPGDPSSSGKNISITPTIPPPPWGRIMRICGRPSSLIPNVTCPVPRNGPLSEVTDARICSTKAALMGNAEIVC